MRLSNKVVLVTGGGSGIGESLAKKFAMEGAKVIVGDLNYDGACSVADELNKAGGQAYPLSVDIVKRSEVEKFISDSLDHFGRIDILINNAGVGIRSSFLETTEEDWDKTININLKGTFLCSQIAAKVMVKQGEGGKIINMSSICGAVADKFSMHAPYECSKAGVNLLTKVMAKELAVYNINVNAIGPGRIKTPLLRSDLDHVNNVLSQIPLNRYGTPEDVANTAFFLASNESGYITGQTIYVDGGWLVH